MTAKHTPASFWAKGERVGPCLIWPGEVTRWGYGRVRYHGKKWTVSRLAWTLARRPIPAGMSVLHTCDNPRCYEPLHLFLGTNLLNQQDRAAKGRTTGRNGSQNSHGLSDVTVRAIQADLADGLGVTAIFQRHGTSRTTIRRIKRGERRPDVT